MAGDNNIYTIKPKHILFTDGTFGKLEQEVNMCKAIDAVTKY